MSYWSIFVRELQYVLHQHGLDLRDLDARAGIHREKVRRLVQSLHTPESLPALNTEEMTRVISALSLNDQDIIRLQAALLTNNLQRTLSLHIEQDAAYLAADQTFPVILKSLQDEAATEDKESTRGGDFEASEGTGLDSALTSALDAIDSGMEALQLCTSMNSHAKRVKKALQARANFTEAIDDLKHLSMSIQWQPSWQYWYAEARKGLASANRLLEEMGEA